MKPKKEKKFKVMKSEIGMAYNWVYQCPICKTVMKYDFKEWMFEGGGLGVECVCGRFGQVITKQDMDEATLISSEEYSKCVSE